jgi:hypothetical protein
MKKAALGTPGWMRMPVDGCLFIGGLEFMTGPRWNLNANDLAFRMLPCGGPSSAVHESSSRVGH